MNHNCCAEGENCAALISADVDGALSPEEHRRLMAHLAGCPACREVYEQTLLLHEAFSDWEEPEIPGDLTAAVMTRVRAERTRARRRPLRRFAAAAVCLALILCGAKMLPQDRPAVAKASPGEAVMAEAAQNDALPGSASEGIPSAAPEVRMANPPSQEQLMEGAITYFNSVPDDGDLPEGEDGVSPQSGKRAWEVQPLSVPTLSSSDPDLLDWMTANIAGAGYHPDGEANSAGAIVWLISEEEYTALQAHITEVSMTYEMDWGIAAAAVTTADGASEEDDAPEDGEEAVICVVYLQKKE